MIERQRGDILRADVEALVNTVNCVGVMGRGIALQFKKLFPENFKVYRAACDRKELRPGMMLVHDRACVIEPGFKRPDLPSSPRIVQKGCYISGR